MVKSARAEGERKALILMARERFGTIPDWATERVDSLAAQEFEQMLLRLLDANSLEDLFN